MEIKHYYSLHNKWLEDLADEISKVSGEEVVLKNNTLILPDSLGKGIYRLYEFSNNMSVIVMECIFIKPVKIHRIPVPGNVSYKIIFNVSDAPIIVSNESDIHVDISGNRADSIFFESHSTETYMHIAANRSIRLVSLIFNKSWTHQYLAKEMSVTNTGKLGQLVNNALMQFTASLDLDMYHVVEDMLAHNPVTNAFPNYLEGCAYQLLALFFQELIVNDLRKELSYADERSRIQALIQEIEEHIDEPVPNLHYAARKCIMGKTRFCSIFKNLTQQSYGEYFQSLKLLKAKNYLIEGLSVKEVAKKIGYSNTSFFIRIFTKYFGDSPAAYLTN
ncbi:AraC family transcriptional regulator [Danxiaibacter flavus]|uniref:AraC family transcriptional regulator n=1 Tax=Danxiaibacter flavus TaxID=3049108 RepID=A0ABV3ZIP9_9BACT|nr:AraC family transcriptional regulator [Chitinophagaceae bacterium DXS]